MNIEPTYVTFEQAKQLASKGYPQDSLNRYPLVDIFGSYKAEELSFILEESGDEGIAFEHSVVAPEQWEVIEWLRINHGIHITTYPVGMGYYCYKIFTVKLRENPTDRIVQDKKDSLSYDELFNSPQEAYSAAFDYVLNNLI